MRAPDRHEPRTRKAARRALSGEPELTGPSGEGSRGDFTAFGAGSDCAIPGPARSSRRP